VTEAERYFFLHIPKTAGIALYGRLRNHFGADAIYPLPAERSLVGASGDVAFLRRSFDTHHDQIRLVTGHFPLCVTEVLGGSFRTFTLLRDPVERTLSLLRHHRQRVERFRELPLEEIYSDPVVLHGLIHNYMVKLLTLTPDEMPAHGALTMVPYTHDRLERAQQNLQLRVEVVGLQEHFEEFCGRLAARFGWELGEPTFPNRTEPVDVGGELRERIAHDNAMDVELYHFAEQLVVVQRDQS
jgi:hypothetical protein